MEFSFNRRIAQLRRIQKSNLYLECVIRRKAKHLMQDLDGTNQY